jgi:hypothetical protein
MAHNYPLILVFVQRGLRATQLRRKTMFQMTKEILELSEKDMDLAVRIAVEQIHKDWDSVYSAADDAGKAELTRLKNKYQKLCEIDLETAVHLLMIREAKLLFANPPQ